MSGRRAESGYTLIELIVALTISTIVLVGIYTVVSSFVNIEVEGVKKGTAAGWSLAGIDAMNREIENANVVGWPAAGGAGDSLVACMNWTRVTGGNLNGVGISGGGGVPKPVYVYYYCYDAANNILRRKYSTTVGTCPAAALAPCDDPTYGPNNVVAITVYRNPVPPANNPGQLVFVRDDAMNAVRILFRVGNPSPAPNTALTGTTPRGNVTNPQSLAIDTRVSLDRPMGSIGAGD